MITLRLTQEEFGRKCGASGLVKSHSQYTSVAIVTLINGDVLKIPLNPTGELDWYWEQVNAGIKEYVKALNTIETYLWDKK